MVSSDELIQRMVQLGLDFQLECHSKIYNMAGSQTLELKLTGVRCKNLVLKDKQKRHCLLMTTSERSTDLSALSKALGTSRLSFASTESLLELLGVTPGAVSPLALVNDDGAEVTLLIDRALERTDFFVLHPLDNGKSVQLSAGVLKTFTEALSRPITWIEVHDRRNETLLN